jgi:hypothetical protein
MAGILTGSMPEQRLLFYLCIVVVLMCSVSIRAEDVIGMDISILDRIPDANHEVLASGSSLADQDVRYRAFVQRQIVHPSKLVHTADELVHLAVIASNINMTATEKDPDQEKVPRTQDEVALYLRGFLRMMFSLFSASTGSPIHLVMITDRAVLGTFLC